MKATMSWTDRLPMLPPMQRSLLVFSFHLVLFPAAYFLAFFLRFDFSIPIVWEPTMWRVLPLAMGVKLLVFGLLKMYQGWWKYVSLGDIVTLAKALFIASAAFLAANIFFLGDAFPRSVYLLDLGITLVLLGGARGSVRIFRESNQSRQAKTKTINVIIMGAGDTGEMLCREITKNPNLPFRVIGFLDDAAYKRGLRIHGIPVLGPISKAQDMVSTHNIKQFMIAMPSATKEDTRRVVEIAKQTGIPTKILPAIESILAGEVSLNALREVSISDLLGREAVELDMQSIGRFLEDQTILVTGAGGSIGSEICRQVMRFNPEKLLMVERGETPLFFIDRELKRKYDDKEIIPFIADITERETMERIFATHRPHVVIHAAAYKHVPLMESHPWQAVLNNVIGTQQIAELSGEFGVKSFVLISTDKAVNPTSVMGATKRVTELYILAANKRFANTDFNGVRFGNVLGSNGSVVPIFREQIRRGGPVTVTHPEMTRYFMTIPEASQLVLQAASFGDSGRMFVLDMGEPIKIAELAKDMIRLTGLDETQIEITYTGMRPGEKLFEELSLDEETLDKTKHKKIFIGDTADNDLVLLEEFFDGLIDAARRANAVDIRTHLKSIIPPYKYTPVDNVISIEAARTQKKAD